MSKNSTTGWVDFFDTPTFNADGSEFIYVASQPQDNGDSYKHLTSVNMKTGTETALTKGLFSVKDILKWDQATDTIVYSATTEKAAYVQHIYLLNANGSHGPHCLTCDYTQGNIPQTYFSATFNPTGSETREFR